MNSRKPENPKTRPLSPYAHLTKEERLKVFANMIVDRIIEEEELYKERLKTDPNAKRIFDMCECEKCLARRKQEKKTK